MKVTQMDGYQIEYPPNQLARKVKRSGGVSPEEMEAEAGRQFARLADDYRAAAVLTISGMKQKVEQLQAEPGNTTVRQALFRDAHDLKGQSLTFGFGLLGLIAERLCRLIEARGENMASYLPLAHIHIDAMAWVMDSGLRDEKSAEAVTILAGLDLGSKFSV